MNKQIRKICLLGAERVGKTSLVQRYVHDSFSETYKSTIGVSLSKKTLLSEGLETVLMIWDLEGNSDPGTFPLDYMRGAFGAIAVVDVERPETLEKALLFSKSFRSSNAAGRCFLALNKNDLLEGRETKEFWDHQMEILAENKLFSGVHFTSAKIGTAVEDLFLKLSAPPKEG